MLFTTLLRLLSEAHFCGPGHDRCVGYARGLPVPALQRAARRVSHTHRAPQAHFWDTPSEGVPRETTTGPLLSQLQIRPERSGRLARQVGICHASTRLIALETLSFSERLFSNSIIEFKTNWKLSLSIWFRVLQYLLIHNSRSHHNAL